jgi:hypothetical protein
MFDYRKCERCKAEYRPVRQDQSYCSKRCKRAAAYGRERFAKGTKGTRKRRSRKFRAADQNFSSAWNNEPRHLVMRAKGHKRGFHHEQSGF